MKAIILKECGGVQNLIHSEITTPTAGANEVLVQVKAIGINPIDVKTRSGEGLYSMLSTANPIILGWDISGIVTHSNASEFKKGDEVFGMINFPGHGKAYAEYVVCPAGQLALKPTNITHEEAAAATLAALTAYQAIVHNGKVKKGDRVLIHAAAGGVGHYAVQLAKHLGAYVIGTSSCKNKDFVIDLGADQHIDYQKQSLAEATQDIDFVLDTLGGDNIDKSLLVMKKGSTLISLPSGLSPEVAEKAKAKGMQGSFMLVTSSGADMQAIAALLAEQKVLKSVIFSKTYDFKDLSEAHLQIETGRTIGKIVVTL